jgi:hypothetical protein
MQRDARLDGARSRRLRVLEPATATAATAREPASTSRVRAVFASNASISKRADLLIAALVVLAVAAPMLLTDSGFSLDFTNHLWLTWVAGKELVQSGHPSYFLNATGVGIFYPYFAFYGGTLYAAVGAISELLGGHPIAAYIGATMLAVAGAYGGMVWLARQLGLRGWMSVAPALTVVTSAYFITNLYGRGAWPEFMATAAIAPLLASGVYLVNAHEWRPGPVLVFVVSAIVFTGSHNITLVWGSFLLACTAVVVWLALGAPRALPVRRLAMVGGLGVLCVAVNAWYLVPDVSYAKDVIAHLDASEGVIATFFDTPAVLFNPLRHVPFESTTPALYVQIPVWFLMWALLSGAVLLWGRGAGGALRWAWLGMAAILACVLAMIMITPFWKVVPYPFDEIQFPYRLGTYVYYSVGALVLLSALALQRRAAHTRPGRRVHALRIALAAVCAVSIGLCLWQLWVPDTLFPEGSYTNRQQALRSTSLVPHSWYDVESYDDVQAPIVSVPSGRKLFIEPSRIHGDRFSAWVSAPAGMAPIQTNIEGGSYLVHISGLARIGRSKRGGAVVRRETNGSGRVHLTVETAHSATLVASWVISIAALLAVAAVVLCTAVSRPLRARRTA